MIDSYIPHWSHFERTRPQPLIVGHRHIYITGCLFPCHQNLIKEFAIKYVVSVCYPLSKSVRDQFHLNDIKFMSIKIDDYDTSLIPFGKLIKWIDTQTYDDSSNKIILVHCQAGMSRSVSVVLAWLISNYINKSHDYKLCDLSISNLINDKLITIRQIREIAKPNKGFIHQLHKYTKDLIIRNISNYLVRNSLKYNKLTINIVIDYLIN